MNEQEIQKTLSLYGDSGPEQCVRQVAEIIETSYSPLSIRLMDDGRGFGSDDKSGDRQGVCAVHGQLLEGDVLAVQLLLVAVKGDLRVSATTFFEHLACLGDKCRVVNPPETVKRGKNGFWVELRVSAVPFSLVRESAFSAELSKLDDFARALRSAMPEPHDDKKIFKLYEPHKRALDAVFPAPGGITVLPSEMVKFVKETLGYLKGGASIALESPYPVMAHYCLQALATCAADAGDTLGKLKSATVNTKGLGEVAKKAPGLVAVSAPGITLGTNAYEMSNEVSCMLTNLSAANTPIIFWGTQEQLQSVFGGGQGGGADPLCPVVRHIPKVTMSILVDFAVDIAARSAGGLPKGDQDKISNMIIEGFKGFHGTTRRRILQAVATRCITAFTSGESVTPEVVSTYASDISSLKETLAGLSPRPRASRSAEVQHNYIKVMTGPGLFEYFRKHLYAQDQALLQLCERLGTEALTRPSHQPICYCAQGTPGTGKSESSILLAKALGVPHINIDAASMPDYYTASAQLLGSGRGIVGSYQSGRLEQASKCHNGVVVEVSDIDHAVDTVRSALADLFLQVLGTGEAQSAAGAMFSCPNLIFAFTMNLPDGKDESVRKRVGFNDFISRDELANDVEVYIKQMLSSAFISRIGKPVVFDPLGGAALETILENTVRDAILTAAKRSDMHIAGVILEPGLGAATVELMKDRVISKGARALFEHGRTLAANAFIRMRRDFNDLSSCVLHVDFNQHEKMIIKPEIGDVQL